MSEMFTIETESKNEQAAVSPDAAGGNRSFDYRPVPMVVPMALFLGLSSGIGLVAISGLVLGLMGFILGLIAWRVVVKGDGAYGGKKLAITALSLSTIFLISGTCLHAYHYTHEVPEGFTRVNFTRDIAKKKLIQKNGITDIHPDVKQLAGQQIFLKGYMYPVRQQTGLTGFVIVRDNGDCCFGGQPPVTDMILVTMNKGMKVDYRPTMVSVAGEFVLRDVRKNAANTNLRPVYQIKASYFTPSKTTY